MLKEYAPLRNAPDIIGIVIVLQNAIIMRKDNMNKFYKLLIMFQTGERVTRKRLLKIVSSELIDEAQENGYIALLKNDDGEIVYMITSKGKEKRDS